MGTHTYRSTIGVLVGAGALMALSACASLDPTEDTARARGLVGDRVALDPAWDLPWDEPSLAWDGASPLSSEQAVAAALQNNRRVRAAVESIASAQARAVQAGLAPNPVITLAWGVPLDGLGGSPVAHSLMQQLAWLWQRDAQIDRGEAALRAQVLTAADEALRLIAQVRTVHAEAVLAREAIAIEEQRVAHAEGFAALARERFGAGESTRVDWNNAMGEAAQASSALALARGEAGAKVRTLLELMGRAGELRTVVLDGVALEPDAALALGEAEVVAMVAERRLDVAAAYERIGVADAGARVARAERLPDVDLRVGYQENFADRPGVFPGVSITPRLFDDGSAGQAVAESDARRAEIEADGLLQRATREARTALVQLREAIDAHRRIDEDLLGLALESERLAEAMFDAGEADLGELLSARVGATRAALAVNQAQANALRWAFELERAVGGFAPMPASGEEVASR